MKRSESVTKTSKSRHSSTSSLRTRLPRITSPNLRYVVCVKNGGYVDLELLKVYQVRHDSTAKEMGLLRVIDSTEEDYLYPADYFMPIMAS